MPASTSDTTARLLCSSVDTIFSVPVVAFIGYPPCFALSERGCPPHHQKVIPQCGLVVNAGLLPLTGRWQGRVSARSAVLRVFFTRSTAANHCLMAGGFVGLSSLALGLLRNLEEESKITQLRSYFNLTGQPYLRLRALHPVHRLLHPQIFRRLLAFGAPTPCPAVLLGSCIGHAAAICRGRRAAATCTFARSHNRAIADTSLRQYQLDPFGSKLLNLISESTKTGSNSVVHRRNAPLYCLRKLVEPFL